MKLYTYLLTLLFAGQCCIAQFKKPGDDCRDIVSSKVLNTAYSTLSIDSFKGKMIVLDYWNHGCISCVRDFERLDSLQKKFADKIQIILVCPESLDSTKKFLAKRKKISFYSLPAITDGRLLWNKFTNSRTPRQVWIDPEGKYQYLTSSKNLQVATITAFLEKKQLPITNHATLVKSEKLQPMSGTLYYSNLSKMDVSELNMVTFNREINNGASVMALVTGAPAVGLYKLAYEEKVKYQFSKQQLILEVPDLSKWQKPSDIFLQDQWIEENYYRYELIVPADKKSQIFEYMKKDLDRFFGLKVSIEKRALPVYFMVWNGKSDKLLTKGGKPRNQISYYSEKSTLPDSLLYLENHPIQILIEAINGTFWNGVSMTLVDKTNLKQSIDLYVRATSMVPFNLEMLREDLQKFGLDIIKGEQLVDVLILKE